jgi:hypothetical protein
MAARQRAIIQGRIARKTIFSNISITVQYDVKKLTKSTLVELKACIMKNLEFLQQDISMGLAAENSENTEGQDEDQEEVIELTTSLITEHSRVVRNLKS